METLTTGMSGYFRPASAVTSSHHLDKLLLGMMMMLSTRPNGNYPCLVIPVMYIGGHLT